MSQSIGFVGLGQMGMPIAKRLLAAGHRVTAFDQREETRALLEAAGGEWAASPQIIADQCPVVFVSLPTPEAVEAVVFGPEGLVHGRELKVYVDLSTTGPATAQKIAAGLAERGVVAMDAPVSGGVAGAEQGTLAIMVSGPRERFEQLRPVLASFGANLFHVGELPGQGHLMKLINNLLSTTALAATYEALSVGAKAGLDPKIMLDILAVSSGTNHAIESKIPNYVMRNLPMGFALDLSYKDVSLAVQAGEALCGPMRMGRVTQQFWEEAMRSGGPKQDYLQVVRVFEDWAGIRWAAPPAAEAAPLP
jgi:3-hydroxyisobutyrate dehydrogenase-like beta-hydroxyacid dehydrogenase